MFAALRTCVYALAGLACGFLLFFGLRPSAVSLSQQGIAFWLAIGAIVASCVFGTLMLLRWRSGGGDVGKRRKALKRASSGAGAEGETTFMRTDEAEKMAHTASPADREHDGV